MQSQLGLCIYLCRLYALHTGQSLQTIDLHGVLSLTNEQSVKLWAVVLQSQATGKAQPLVTVLLTRRP